jgi:NAD(P)H-hydrate epimerase
LFGTGLDRPVAGLHAKVIERINAAPQDVPRVALDIPSGLDADSGAVLGHAVEATHTVTFASHKRGMHQHPGAQLAGELTLASIGVPAPLESSCQQLEAADVARWVPRRQPDAHKGTGGHVLVLAGGPGRTGAALLSGLAALRSGAGLVTLCPRSGARAALDAKVIELMTADLPAGVEDALAAIAQLVKDKHAAVLGPGFGLDDDGRTLLVKLAVSLPKPCVLDADALTAIGDQLGTLKQAAAERVLTPHPAEAARVLGLSTPEVQADRYRAVTRLAAESGQVAVLKGARTLIAHPDGRIHVCPLDTPALAVAGTGDVLTGVIAALLPSFGSQPAGSAGGKLGAFGAASAAVYLHARAGALAAHSDRGLFAREVADAIPHALEACRSEAHARP